MMTDATKKTIETYGKVVGIIAAIVAHFVLLTKMFNAVENRTVINEQAIVRLQEDTRETKAIIKDMNNAIQDIRDAVTAMEARDEVLRREK